VVLEAYRGHAVGRTLVTKAIEEAKRLGVTAVELGTANFQARAEVGACARRGAVAAPVRGPLFVGTPGMGAVLGV
jgi:GNAT superfamily N-acetyltransferase